MLHRIKILLKVELNEYIRIQKLKNLGRLVKNKPVHFEFTAEKIRCLNREE